MFGRRRRPAVSPDQCSAIINTSVALASRLEVDLAPRLQDITLELIETKRWEAVGTVDLSPEVLVTVAANAAIPVLALDTWLYRNVGSIIVTSSPTTVTARRAGPAGGVFSDSPMRVAGRTGPNSTPVCVAWSEAIVDSRRPDRGRNVVIHEMTHKIDMAGGFSDGEPPLRGAEASHWKTLLDDQYLGEPLEDEPLRAYAWSNRSEFFAVATEVFFCRPAHLAAARPRLYEGLRGIYRQDPRHHDASS